MMRRTYQITVKDTKSWWTEIGARGHKIILTFGTIALIGFALLVYSAIDGIYTKMYYREKIRQNEERLRELESRQR